MASRRRAVAAVLAAAAVLGCSPSARRKALDFFLDGVPPEQAPSAPRHEAKAPDAAAPAPATPEPAAGGAVQHPPYEARLCDSCHNFGGAGKALLQAQPPDLCNVCHQRVDEGKGSLHWPVRQGRCLLCHDPHRAPHAKLLRRKAPELCLDCHGESRLKHGVDMGVCTDCHDPHSSAAASLIKD